MSVAFDSPPVPISSQPDSYFNPRATPYNTATPQEGESPTTVGTGETPYFTAPVSPMTHQDFFNAIQSRHSSVTFNTPAISTPSTPVPQTPWNHPSSVATTLSATGLAGRRKSPLATIPLPPPAFPPPQTAVNNGPPAVPFSGPARLLPFTPDQLARLLTTQSCVPLDFGVALNSNPSVVQSLPNLKRPAHFTQPVLVLDMRSFVHYSHGRVKSSVNVCIPNTILRRGTFTLDKVYEAIVSEGDRSRLRKWDTFANIVLYDNNSEMMQDGCAIVYLCQKLQQEKYNGSLGYLKGGYLAFSASHFDLCDTTIPPLVRVPSAHLTLTSASAAPLGVMTGTPTNEYPPPHPTFASIGPTTTSGISHPGQSLPLHARRPPLAQFAANLGPFTAPTPHFDNQAFNPFFSNIRQNMELGHGGITERFPIRLPKDIVLEQEAGVIKGGKPVRKLLGTGGQGGRAGKFLPKWLREVVKGEGEGEKYLAEKYERIEKQEQRRLQNLMLHHSKSHNHAEHPLSIVAGIEKGTLNRYTNVWPFEYTRVKITDCSDGCDYINASFVQYPDSTSSVSPVSSTDYPPRSMEVSGKRKSGGCARRQNRRYIATQGPLPTTFVDFWKVVWEQSSRIIVMLTREEEMNRTKCHCYWPTTPYQPTAYGPLKVTLLTETRLTVSSSEDVIIIRQLTISHTSSPAGTSARTITHMQYTGWQDFSVPDDPVGCLRLVHLTNQAQTLYERESAEDQRERENEGVDAATAAKEAEVGPMIVHCSAGCGRSGAFCTIDTVMRKMAGLDRLDGGEGTETEDEEEEARRATEAEGTVDLLYETVERFREQRVSMVQTLRQYVFCYEAVMWWTLGYGSAKEEAGEGLAIEMGEE